MLFWASLVLRNRSQHVWRSCFVVLKVVYICSPTQQGRQVVSRASVAI